MITSRQLLPLPVAENYLVRRRRREREEEKREASSRRPNVVAQLLEANEIEPGTELKLELDAFTQEERGLIERKVKSDPEIGKAEWTGLSSRKAIRWRGDGQEYSATKLVVKILQEQGFDRRAVLGPCYWKIPDGRTLVKVADELGESGEELSIEEIVEVEAATE